MCHSTDGNDKHCHRERSENGVIKAWPEWRACYVICLAWYLLSIRLHVYSSRLIPNETEWWLGGVIPDGNLAHPDFCSYILEICAHSVETSSNQQVSGKQFSSVLKRNFNFYARQPLLCTTCRYKLVSSTHYQSVHKTGLEYALWKHLSTAYLQSALILRLQLSFTERKNAVCITTAITRTIITKPQV